MDSTPGPFSHTKADLWVDVGHYLKTLDLYALSCASQRFYKLVWEVLLPSSPFGLRFHQREPDLVKMAEYLARVPNLATLRLGNPTTDCLLTTLSKLSSLRLPTRCIPETWSHLTNLTYLRSTDVHPRCLAPLTKLQALKGVGCCDNKILLAASLLPELQELSMRFSHGQHPQFEVLSSLTKLKFLEYDCQEGLTWPVNPFLPLTTLETLKATGSVMFPEGLTNLKKLDLFTSDETIIQQAIASFTKLEHLRIRSGTQHHITAELSRLTNLRYLSIYQSSCSPETLASFTTLTNLTDLNLNGPDIEDEDSKHQEFTDTIRPLTTLKHLDVTHDYRCLELLYLEKLTIIADEEYSHIHSNLKYLAHMTTLKELVMVGAELCQRDLPLLQGLKNLKHMKFRVDENIDTQVEMLCTLTQLTHLDLSCSPMAATGLEPIGRSLTGLKVLDLSWCPNVPRPPGPKPSFEALKGLDLLQVKMY